MVVGYATAQSWTDLNDNDIRTTVLCTGSAMKEGTSGLGALCDFINAI